MLKVQNAEHFAAVQEHAKRIGMLDQLQQKLDYLGGYKLRGEIETVCYLRKDFAPHSFYFELCRAADDKLIFNGGLIFHGEHDRGGDGGAPTFSVNLTPSKGWEIHT